MKPRRSLFTPHKVKKGPGKDAKMSSVRFTRGVTASGRTFEFHDDWQAPNNSHRLLEEPWVGYTINLAEGVSNLSFRTRERRDAAAAAEPKPRWSDLD